MHLDKKLSYYFWSVSLIKTFHQFVIKECRFNNRHGNRIYIQHTKHLNYNYIGFQDMKTCSAFLSIAIHLLQTIHHPHRLRLEEETSDTSGWAQIYAMNCWSCLWTPNKSLNNDISDSRKTLSLVQDNTDSYENPLLLWKTMLSHSTVNMIICIKKENASL